MLHEIDCVGCPIALHLMRKAPSACTVRCCLPQRCRTVIHFDDRSSFGGTIQCWSGMSFVEPLLATVPVTGSTLSSTVVMTGMPALPPSPGAVVSIKNEKVSERTTYRSCCICSRSRNGMI